MRSGFFNSNITGYDEQGMPIFDRAEDATFFAKYFSQFVGNGVFAEPQDGLMVLANDGLQISVKAGVCFINGYMGWLELDQQMSLSPASEVYNRIDRVVARYDAVQRNIDLFVLEGTPSESPVAPALTREEHGDIYELALADILVTRNAVAVRQADITDLRLDEQVCGVVASPVEHLETGAANAQLTDAFNQWFERIKGQLSEDAAGHLQTQLDEHTSNHQIHVMTGCIQLWAGQSEPNGWLFCNGQAVSRTAYPELFSVIGTLYGQGDGATTFNVPDLRGRVPMGANQTYTLASTGGEVEHVLTEPELPKVTGHIEMHNSGTGTNIFGTGGALNSPNYKINSYFRDGGNRSGGANSYGGIDLHFGENQPHNNLQPYIAQHYIIKA